MEITKSNFTEKLDEIADAIKQATFLSIDGEFTGLDKSGSSHVNPFDMPNDRYRSLREGSLDFLLVQFGLCAFKFIEETQSYEARPFNFYIFPRPYTRQAPDRRFLCQSSSIDFLVQNEFDFNKMFREGIPYLTPTQEDEMRQSLNMKHQAFSKFSSPAFFSPDSAQMGPGKGPIQIPDDQKDFIENTCDKISKFMESTDERDELQLAPCNGFQRKLTYQTVRTKFSSVHLETKTGEKKERYIVVTKVKSDEELKKKEKQKQNLEIMELEEAVGFAKVIKLIAQSEKIVAGHNMILDLMHMLNQFCYPLPQELEEFKAMVRCSFPRLLDTKHMASTHPFRDVIPNNALGNLQHTLESEPFTPAKVELPEEFSRYKDADKYHEAGFDAYVTGCMLATMANYLGRKEASAKPVVVPTSTLVEPFMNKLFMMKIADIPYLNMAGPDLQPSRNHVFHLTFPREWKASDINNLFGVFGNIHISWQNETSAFVSLYKKDNADAAMKGLGESTLYKLVPYNVYKRMVAASSSSVPSAPSLQPSTPKTSLKRPAPGDAENKKESPEPAVKKLRSEDLGVVRVDVMEEDEIPELVPRAQFEKLQKKASKKEAAEADSTELFAVPKDW